MKILITGGSGFIGRHLIVSMAKKGAHVRVLTRRHNSGNEFGNIVVEPIRGDLANRDSLRRAVDGVDIVYHLAAQIGKWGVPEERYYASNVRGTRNLLDACLQSSVGQFVFCSTPGVQGKGHVRAQECLPYNPPYIYERTKCEAEKLVLKFHRDHRLPVTILRPDFVYGPGDLRRLPLYRAVKNGKFFIIGNGKSFLHPTYIDDVIQGFHLVAGNPVAFGRIFNIGGPHLVTVGEYVGSIARSLDVPNPRMKIPAALALATAAGCEALSRITGREPYITRSKIEFLTKSHGTDISNAQTELGYRPGYALQEGLRRTIDWYRDHRLL